MKKNLSDRFWPKVDKRGPDECWEWKASKGSRGYGHFRTYPTADRAHRVAWELTHHDPIPDGMCVCHVCDNPGCVNPAHLFVGTQGDNVRDSWAKGRGKHQVHTGEDHPMAKLTETDVKFIRHWAKRGYTLQEIGDVFGVSFQTISRIKLRNGWRHV